MAMCKVLMKIASRTKTSSYMVEQDGKYFKLNVPNMIEGNEIELKELKLEDLNPNWIERYKKWNRKRATLLKHLEGYKKDTLKIEVSGVWTNNKEYAHILPVGQEKRNLIDGAFSEALNKNADSIPLHPSFGHLNSSQAMCLNFMVPLLERGILLEYIKKSCPDAVRGTRLKKQIFERIVDENERTQFDFYCTTDTEETLSFEFKYSEPDFSVMKDDERHQEKFETIYKDRLTKHGISIDKETFAADYQLWRNILYAGTHQHTVFFVFPKFREDLKEAVESAKKKCPAEIQQRIHCICIDDWVEDLLKSDDTALKAHYEAFKEKYLPEL
ncbi:MAG: hypothetical protein J6C11_04595 [Spirochaetaceae bacterium]|nr:hypothetical protein [Spirochaetaceae bacterium]